MFLAMLLASCVLVNAEVLSVEDQHLVSCLKNMSVRYFNPGRTLVISLWHHAHSKIDYRPLFSTNSTEFAIENVLVEEINKVQMWPIVTSRSLGTSDTKSTKEPIHDTQESYIIVAHGTGAEEVLEGIMGQIQTLSYHPSWNPRARFIVTPITKQDTHSTTRWAQQILSYFWQWKIIDVVALIRAPQPLTTNVTPVSQSCTMFQLYTWFPYDSPDQCSTVKDVFLLDTWTTEGQGRFIKNANLFPIKIKNNLHTCPVIATTFPLTVAVGNASQINTEKETKTKITYSEGWEVSLIKTIAECLNSSIYYILPPPNNEKWGEQLDNGSFTGLTGDLVYNRADIGFAVWPLNPRTLQALDATKTYFRDEWVWWVPCAKKIPRWKSMFMVFSTGTWAAGLFSVAISLLVMVFLAKSEERTGILQEWQVYKRLPSCFSSVWSVLFAVSVSPMPRTSSVRAFFASWVCYCLAITTIFNAFLITYIIDPGLQHQINSFEEIVASGKDFGYHLAIGAIIEESDDILMKQGVPCDSNDVPPCLSWVAYHNNFSLLSSMTFMDYTLTRWFLDENGKPLICQAGDTFYGANYVTYMTKGSPLLSHFNRLIAKHMEAGFLNHILKKGMDLQRIQAAVRARDVLVGKYYDLSMEHLQGAFLVCICGLTLSCIVFAGELLCLQFSIRQERRAKATHSMLSPQCNVNNLTVIPRLTSDPANEFFG
jgi:hypothetical protein